MKRKNSKLYIIPSNCFINVRLVSFMHILTTYKDKLFFLDIIAGSAAGGMLILVCLIVLIVVLMNRLVSIVYSEKNKSRLC